MRCKFIIVAVVLALAFTLESAKAQAGPGKVGGGEKEKTLTERLRKSAIEVAVQRQAILGMIGELEKEKKLDAGQCFMAAEAAMLIGSPEKAIPLLERLMKENPDGKHSILELPLSVTVQFRIGMLARYGGQWDRAIDAYKAVMEDKGLTEQERKGYGMLGMFYISEIQAARGQRDKAIETLEAINKHSMEVQKETFEWARWNEEMLKTGKVELAAKTIPADPKDDILTLFAYGTPILMGFWDENVIGRDEKSGVDVHEIVMDKLGSSSISQIDRDSVRVARLTELMKNARNNEEEICRLLKEGIEEEGFLHLQYNSWLALSLVRTKRMDEAREVLKKMDERYPQASDSPLFGRIRNSFDPK